MGDKMVKKEVLVYRRNGLFDCGSMILSVGSAVQAEDTRNHRSV
jgi:hypothetical protein